MYMAQTLIHLISCSNLSLKLEKLHDDQHIIVEGDFNIIINMNLDFKKKTKTLTIKR